MSNKIDKRLTQACNELAEKAQELNDSILSLNAVVNDYISADQEREDRIRGLEDEQRALNERLHLRNAYGG